MDDPARQSQAALRRAWHRVLGRRAWRQDRPFVDRPVSLTLLRLLFHLEAALGRSLPAEPFRLARRPGEFLHALQAAPARAVPALFLLPGIGGDDPFLMLLRADLPAGIAMAVITYPDWPEADPLALDFAGVVAEIVAQIEHLAPAGPLRLVGYSLGGHLAYAAALALLARGRDVAHVAILDTAWMVRPPPSPWWSLRRVGRFVAMARRGEALPSAAHFVAKVMLRAPALVRALASRRLRLPLDFGFHLRRALLMALHLRLLGRWLDQVLHDPAPLHSDVVLFRSEEHAPDMPPDLHWRRCCPRLRIVAVPGTHHGMFAPQNIGALRKTLLTATGLG